MQLEVPVDCVRAAAKLADDAGDRIVLDPAPPRILPDDLLALVDVVRANAAEVSALSGVQVYDMASARDGARALLARGCRLSSWKPQKATCSSRARTNSGSPNCPWNVWDATGAGDAFSAALAVALAEGQPLGAAARFASGAAALSTTVLGAQPGLPRRRELDAYLELVAGSGRAAS
jgi:ribokinase